MVAYQLLRANGTLDTDCVLKVHCYITKKGLQQNFFESLVTTLNLRELLFPVQGPAT
jgi:hypothetical protein